LLSPQKSYITAFQCWKTIVSRKISINAKAELCRVV